MKSFKFSALRQKDSWLAPAFVTVNDKGIITALGNKAQVDSTYEEVKGLLLPAFTNAHSHAFQYAMAGLAEVHPAGNRPSDFWSWRNKMYEIALTVDPEDLQSIATMLYAEMVRHGYSHVVEFHYLHHDKAGNPYMNVSEMSERLIVAAANAGINITLVPMLYQQGGFNMPPEDHQRRFISTTDQYLSLLAECKNMLPTYPHLKIGYGAHSIRAAAKENIHSIIAANDNNLPFHIHISEQLKEVEEAQKFLGSRPVQWLAENFPLDENYHLVHATHLLPDEVEKIAEVNANVVLCPSTEGNLGDGLFPLHDFQKHNGRWCIGTDSHIGLNPLEELRLLDYGQRLVTHKRNTFANEGGDNASYPICQAVINGRRAAGIKDTKEFFAIGQPFDGLVVDDSHPLLQGSPDYWLPTILYHLDVSGFSGTIIKGNWIVKNGYHISQSSILSEFTATTKRLKIRN